MTSAVRPAIPDPTFRQVKERIIDRTGHFYYEDKDGLLWDKVRRRLAATRSKNCADYLSLLDEDAGGEWAALEAEITIGETFFFRYAEQFAALEQRILPEILAANRDERRIRVWSAGCASGAEPYSVAILLRRLLADAIGDWHVGIVGTDINDAALTAARAGRFGDWAMRTLPADERGAYFEHEAAGRWVLRPEFRSMVRFERHNLLSLLDGTSPLQFTDFDLVLCRNVLIYFHPDVLLRLVANLRTTMRETGWLLLGHAEPNPAFTQLLDVVNLPGTVAYRRARGDLPAAPPAPTPQPAEPPSVHRPAARPAAAPPRRATPPAPLPPAAGPSEDVVAAVRRQADAGALDAAAALCRSGLERQPTNAALHFYDGVIARALDRPVEAERALRKAIYLDRTLAVAHHQLGLLLFDRGQAVAGRRSIAHAARLVAGIPDSAPLAEAGGMTAGDLRQVARHQLRTPRRSA